LSWEDGPADRWEYIHDMRDKVTRHERVLDMDKKLEIDKVENIISILFITGKIYSKAIPNLICTDQ
jgi:hypothetical protein